jgi:hypothetical protein
MTFPGPPKATFVIGIDVFDLDSYNGSILFWNLG